MRTLALGIGNPLRSDDGVGHRAALALEAEGLPARAEIQLLPEHALALARVERVVFLDASRDAPPGHVTLDRVAPRPGGAFSHRLDPAALLALCHALTGRAPEAVALGIGARRFEAGEALSAEVASGWNELLTRARALLAGARVPTGP